MERHLKKIILAFVTVPLLSGCGQAIEQWVRAVQPLFGVPQKFEGQSNVKISPGTTVSQSSDVSAQVHVTITDRVVTSGDVSASVSLNRTRTEGISQ